LKYRFGYLCSKSNSYYSFPALCSLLAFSFCQETGIGFILFFPTGSDFQKQKKHPGRETRMRERFGNDYTFSKNIAGWFEKKGNKQNVLVLIPPTIILLKWISVIMYRNQPCFIIIRD